MKSRLYIKYENGTGMGLSCFTTRELYRLAFRAIRRWDHVQSAEIETGTAKLEMCAREYAGGRYVVLSRGDGSIVSAWALNGNRKGRNKGEY